MQSHLSAPGRYDAPDVVDVLLITRSINHFYGTHYTPEDVAAMDEVTRHMMCAAAIGYNRWYNSAQGRAARE